jgi:pilus assembly protein HofO
MPWIIERWFRGPCWVRVVSLAIFIGLVVCMAWLFLMRPQQSLRQQLERDNQQASQRVAELRRKIPPLIKPVPMLLPAQPPVFSVTEFVGKSGGKLLKWQPDNKQGDLEMLVPWEKLPGLFARLAEYRVVTSNAFTLTSQGELLKLVLAMEFDDEP